MPTRIPFPADDVCIVLLSGIGDVVHGLPVANALKADDPGRRVTWVAEPAPARVLEAHPSVDEILVFERGRGAAGVADLWRRFRGRRFDLTLNMQRFSKSIFPTVFSRAPVRIGLDRRRVREGVWLFCNRRLPPRPWGHTQDVFLEFAEVLDLPRPEPLEWRIRFTFAERAAQEEFLAALPGGPEVPVVSFVLASKNPSKDWPAERYAELADRLPAEVGCRVLLVGGPGDREARAARVVLESARTPPVSALGDDVRRLMWLLEASDVVVSPDSGPLHIAHALGVPVVGLFGHTNPARVGPYSRFGDLVVDRYSEPGEAPDPSRREARGRRRMSRITVDEVAERVRLAFQRYVPRRDGPLARPDRPPA